MWKIIFYTYKPRPNISRDKQYDYDVREKCLWLDHLIR